MIKNNLRKFISVKLEEIPSKVFHPLLVLPLTGLAVLILKETGFIESVMWIGLWITVAMVPTSVVAWRTDGKGFDIVSREKRNFSYLTGVLGLASALVLSIFLSAPVAVLELGFFGLCAAVIFGLLNQFTKISVHTGAIGFVSGGFLNLMPSVTISGIFISVLVGWSRVRLEQHTRKQVFQGVAVGLVSGALIAALW